MSIFQATEIKVVNQRTLSEELGWVDVYIGRPSVLGNPFFLKKEADRSLVIEKYRQWLWEQLKLRGEVFLELQRIAGLITSGHQVRLVCHCAPRACHGDIVLKAVRWLLENKERNYD